MTLGSVLAARLLTARNTDGRWGYYDGKASRLEPTCWALLALTGGGEPDGLKWPLSNVLPLLERWQRSEGLLADSGGPPNLAFDGLAAVTLSALLAPEQLPANRCTTRLFRSLVSLQGLGLTYSRYQRQNNSLRGWPWTEGTASWVEPTAWCLLALKRLAAQFPQPFVPPRIAEAEALLVDRCCKGGGWNYGNSNMMGQELRAYVPTTACALLALQDRREVRAVREGLAFLQRSWTAEQSGRALSLTLICLSLYGLPCIEVSAALERRYQETEFLGNLCTVGMALCALRCVQGGPNAFRI